MKHYLLAGLTFVLAVALATPAEAQRARERAVIRAKSREMSRFTVKTKSSRNKRYAAAGAMVGMTNYYGDLNPRNRRLSTALPATRSYLGAFYSQQINANVSIRGSIAWARIRGDDFFTDPNRSIETEARYARNLSFRNDMLEVGGVATIDILPTDRGYLRRNYINGYGLLGLALLTNTPRGLVPQGYGLPNEGRWVKLRPLTTEGQGVREGFRRYSWIQPAILFGGGVRYRIDDKIDIGLEIAWRFTFTDYLDDVSRSFIPDSLASQFSPLTIAMGNRSGEPNAAVTGTARDRRVTAPDRLEQLPGAPEGYQRIKGYATNRFINTNPDGTTTVGIGGSPRGNRDRDGYIVTTITGTYILEFRARTPKFR